MQPPEGPDDWADVTDAELAEKEGTLEWADFSLRQDRLPAAAIFAELSKARHDLARAQRTMNTRTLSIAQRQAALAEAQSAQRYIAQLTREQRKIRMKHGIGDNSPHFQNKG